MRRDLTTRSIILEMRDRFEIGRYLESSSLSNHINVGFLRSGMMTYFLECGMKLAGNKRLTMLVIDRMSTDEHSLISLV